MRKGSGTKSHVQFVIIGDHGDTGVRLLEDRTRKVIYDVMDMHITILNDDIEILYTTYYI